jgi:hypothetical protein
VKRLGKHFDLGSLITILTTLILFGMALFFTGFTHDLLLEAGVFLVSVKLIIMSYKNAVAAEELQQELAGMRIMLEALVARGEARR